MIHTNKTSAPLWLKKTPFLLLFVVLFFSACNKDKRASKRCMRAGTWQITELLHKDTALLSQDLPEWFISDCDIFEKLCEGQFLFNDQQSAFYWQFNNDAEEFTLSRIGIPADTADFYTEEVEWLTYQLSGTYQVMESSRKIKKFRSFNTHGFPTDKIEITLERKE